MSRIENPLSFTNREKRQANKETPTDSTLRAMRFKDLRSLRKTNSENKEKMGKIVNHRNTVYKKTKRLKLIHAKLGTRDT